MNDDLLIALTQRVAALERQNRSVRALAVAITAVVLSVVILGVVSAKADAQRAPGPVTAEDGIYITKNGAIRAQLSVDDADRVQLVLYGTLGSGGGSVPPIADFMQRAGLVPIGVDPQIVLTAGTAGTSINMTGGPTKAAILMGTTRPSGPALALYNSSQVPSLELQGVAMGQALFVANGYFATVDAKGKETWRVPSVPDSTTPAPTAEPSIEAP